MIRSRRIRRIRIYTHLYYIYGTVRLVSTVTVVCIYHLPLQMDAFIVHIHMFPSHILNNTFIQGWQRNSRCGNTGHEIFEGPVI